MWKVASAAASAPPVCYDATEAFATRRLPESQLARAVLGDGKIAEATFTTNNTLDLLNVTTF